MKRTAQDWLDEINTALEYREEFGREGSWFEMEQMFYNDPSSNTAVGPNLIWSMGDSLLSTLLLPSVEFVVEAEHMAGVTRAPVVESVDNWLCRKLKLPRLVADAALYAYLNGKAIVKIGYDSEFGWAPHLDPGLLYMQQYGLTFTQFDKEGHRIEFKDTTPGMPWVSVVPPNDIVVPWGTKYIDDAPWVAHRVIRLNRHLKKDKKYENTSRLDPEISMEDFIQTYELVGAARQRFRTNRQESLVEVHSQALYNEIWEIHDREDMKVIAVTPHHDKLLRDAPDALQAACGMPFIAMDFVPNTRSFWSTPLAYYLKQLQSTQFDISVQSEKQRRISNLRFIADKDAFEEDELDKAISGDVGAVALASPGSARSLADLVVAVPTGSILDFVMMSQNNRSDAREAIGFSRNQLGEFDTSSRRTAREATFVQSGSMLRAGRRSSSIQDFYLDIMTKLNQVCFAFWRLPRDVMVDREWVQFTGEELRGDYLYDISLSSKRMLSRAQRKIEALTMLPTLLQIPGVNPEEVFPWLIAAANDPAFEKLFTAAPRGSRGAAPGGLPTIPATRSEQTAAGGTANAAV